MLIIISPTCFEDMSSEKSKSYDKWKYVYVYVVWQ